MLISLHIENIAVIKSADIDFSGGFTVLTGETGAGKSIIIDSINLILGAKQSRELIRSGEDSAQVSALFGELSHLCMLHMKRHLPLLTQPADKRFIPVGVLTPQPVVDMRRFNGADPELLPQGKQQVEHRNGVCAAGHRRQHSVTRRDQPLGADIPANPVFQAFIPHCDAAPIRRTE